MVNNLSSIDKRVIQSLIKKHSFSDIAEIIDKPLPAVNDYILEYIDGKDIITFQQMQTNKALAKRKQQLEASSEKNRKSDYEKQVKRSRRAQEQEIINNRKRRNEPVFVTKAVDYSRKKLIRIDAKTCVYVDPDTDVEEYRKKYLEKMNKAKPEPEKNYKEVKKFKPID